MSLIGTGRRPATSGPAMSFPIGLTAEQLEMLGNDREGLVHGKAFTDNELAGDGNV